MTYTPPPSNAVHVVMESGYTPPASDAVDITFRDSVTAKSVIIDVGSNHGGTYTGLRSVEFKLDGVLIPLTQSDFTANASSEYGASYIAELAFDTTLSKTGTHVGTSWMTNAGSSGRVLVVFNEVQEFDEIVINNFHVSGATTNIGGDSARIIISDSDSPSNAFEGAVPEQMQLWAGNLTEHPLTDTVSDETIFNGDPFYPRRPGGYSDTYVKATSKWGTQYEPWFGVDPSLKLLGSRGDTSWLTPSGVYTNQKFNVDLGTEEIITRFRMMNQHHNGADTQYGIKNFIIYGTNSTTAFANTTYSNTDNLVSLGSFILDEYTQNFDLQDFDLSSNTTPYRYYVLRIADGYNTTTFIGFRELELLADTKLYTTVQLAASSQAESATSIPAASIKTGLTASVAAVSSTSVAAGEVTSGAVQLTASCDAVSSTQTATGKVKAPLSAAVNAVSSTQTATGEVKAPLSAAVNAASNSPTIAGKVKVPLSVAIYAASNTSVAEGKVFGKVSLSASCTAVSNTQIAAGKVTQRLTATILAGSSTSIATGIFKQRLIASINAMTSTPTIAGTTKGFLSASIVAESDTSLVTGKVFGTVNLIASCAAISNTQIAAGKLKQRLTADISASSNTTAAIGELKQRLTASIFAISQTEAAWALVKNGASINAVSSTSIAQASVRPISSCSLIAFTASVPDKSFRKEAPVVSFSKPYPAISFKKKPSKTC